MKDPSQKPIVSRLSIGLPRFPTVRIDLISAILLLPLVAVLALVLFPILAPELPGTSYWLMSLLAVFGLILSASLRGALLALCARVMRVPIEAYALFLFGPILITRIEGARRGAETILAVVHLTATLLLGILTLSLFAAGFGERPTLHFISPAFLLAFGHFGILVFYLLPGYPLDGGRFLRAALAGKKGWTRATRIALVSAKIVTGLLIVGGILLLATGAPAAGILLLVLGGLLLHATALAKPTIRPSPEN